jgi:hypothetical protein
LDILSRNWILVLGFSSLSHSFFSLFPGFFYWNEGVVAMDFSGMESGCLDGILMAEIGLVWRVKNEGVRRCSGWRFGAVSGQLWGCFVMVCVAVARFC